MPCLRKHPRVVILLFLLMGLFSVTHAQFMSYGGGINQDEALDIAVDAAGNSYVVGYFSSTCTFADAGALTSTGLSDIFVLKASPAGQILWFKKAGGAGEDRALSVSVTAAGDVFVCGYFQSTANFDGSTVTSAGLKDMFVARYNGAGTLQWVKSGGGNGEDMASGVAVDGSGNVSVTGEFENTATFGTSTFVAGNKDVFVCRYGSSGTFLWAKAGAGPENGRGMDVACDAAGNTYVTGQFSEDITFDNTQTNSIYNAVFLVKFNSAGTELWFRKIGGGTSNLAYGICTDASGYVYLTGDFTGNLVFFPNTSSPLTHTYPNRIFLAKYNPAGTLVWAKAGGSVGSVSSRGVTVADNGTIYIAGFFTCKMSQYADVYGQGVFNSLGFKDGFMAQYDASGNWVLARQFGATGNDYANGVAVAGNAFPLLAASYNAKLFIPYKNGMTGPPNTTQWSYCNGGLCNDLNYGDFYKVESAGGSDLAFGVLAHPQHEPLDYYIRTDCVRDQKDICLASAGYCTDTVTFCASGDIFINTNTCNELTPDYVYSWAVPLQNITWGSAHITTTGTYSATATSVDGCFSRTDSIYAIVNPNPPAQGIWDNQGINTPTFMLNGYAQSIEICGDSVLLTGIPVGVDTSYWVIDNGGIATLLNDSVLLVTGSGEFEFRGINAFGCVSWIKVSVLLLDELPPLDTYLSFVQDTDMDDTVTICENEWVEIHLMDHILGQIPCGNEILISHMLVPQLSINTPFTFYCQAGFVGPYAINPEQSGWHTVTWSGVFANGCDSVPFYAMDSVYVVVNPLPVLELGWTGNIEVCPGDTAVLISTNPDAQWSGSNIVSGAGTASILAVPPAMLQLYVDSTTSEGCTSGNSLGVYVHVPDPPQVAIYPTNGIICPNDSVMLAVLPEGISYAWFGPQGALPSDTQLIAVNLPGMYYCAVTYSSGCRMLSNAVEVRQYAAPFLLVTPSPILCGIGDSALVSVITGEGSTVLWNAPLSGNAWEQIVHGPGTYSASVTSCDITTAVEITVSLSEVDAEISTNQGLVFCDGDSVALEATGNEVAYFVWSPGSHYGSPYVVYNAGTYTVTAVDEFGCQKVSAPIEVVTTPNTTVPPVGNDTSFCAPASLSLTVTGQGLIVWYADSMGTTALDTGNVFETPVLTGTTVYYVLNRYNGCSSQMRMLTLSEANCEELDMPNIFTPNGDGMNDILFFDIKGVTCFDVSIYSRWGNKVFETQNASVGWDGTVLPAGLPASDGTYFYVANYCPQAGGSKTQKGFITLLRE